MGVNKFLKISGFIMMVSAIGCGTAERLPKGAELGAGMGRQMGASFGEKSGNSAICALLGAAFFGSAGGVLDRYIAEVTGAHRPSLYIVNGVPYSRKEALNQYKNVQKEEIKSISRLGKEEATARYGSIGEKGAVIIALKDPANSSTSKDSPAKLDVNL